MANIIFHFIFDYIVFIVSMAEFSDFPREKLIVVCKFYQVIEETESYAQVTNTKVPYTFHLYNESRAKVKKKGRERK